ncbi:glucose dehydrogenase [Frigidibacter sp. MR17.24]|uniref:glucose dehydrogenase n=1 Tax=Frigidibacter sp. MR17.24 TaxID=3127345 RepID=UPI003012FF2E
MTYATSAAGAAPPKPAGSRAGGWRIAARVVSAVIGAIGLALIAGGIWLILLGGSWYYAIAGLGLAATAALLWMQDARALRVYLVTWLFTLAWAFWEVGADWWAQVPRLVAPTVILMILLIMIPALHSPRANRLGARKETP